MGGKILLLPFLFILLTPLMLSDTGSKISESCLGLCEEERWDAATKCFRKEMDPPAAYLATASCAWNNNKDDIAEEYALKSASSRKEWATFINRFGYTIIYTGGLGETYALAHAASGGARHRSTALRYLKTSRQCSDVEEKDECAESYLNNVLSQYYIRDIQAVRSTGSSLQKAIRGIVTDHFDRPIKHAKVNYRCQDGRDNIAFTDESGMYNISFGSIMDVSEACTRGKLFVKFTYTDPKDDRIYFRMMLSGKETTVYKDINIRSDADLKQNFILKSPLSAEYRSDLPLDQVIDQAVMYYHMSEALEFWKDEMKANVNYKLPVDVISHQTIFPTSYHPREAQIYIKHSDSPITSSNRPMNREWHEFNHHVMFSQHSMWPNRGANSINHNGYANPTTGDSYMEGFAEFWAGVMAEHYKYPNPHVYPIFGSLEVNWKAWQRRGFYEEVAVAGALWDIYDISTDENLQMKKEDIWLVLKVYHKDFNEVYEEFKSKFPRNSELFDKIWILHGFWKDNTTGNDIFEVDEAFRDYNRNYAHDPGEPYIDYGTDTITGARKMTREPNEKIGPSANYHRQWRTNAVMIPMDDVLVENNIPTYKVDVRFKSDPSFDYIYYSDNLDGRINVVIPEEDATVTITPESVVGAKPLVLTSDFYHDNLEKSIEQGYLIEHDFGVADIELPKRSPPSNPPRTDSVPYWEYDYGAAKSDYRYDPPKEDPWEALEKRNIPWGLALFVVSALAVIIILSKKKRK